MHTQTTRLTWRTVLLSLVTLVLAGADASGAAASTWSRLVSEFGAESVAAALRTPEGRIVLVGTGSDGAQPGLRVVLLDPDGAPLGGTAVHAEEAWLYPQCAALTSDGGVVVGVPVSPGSSADVGLLRFDAAGALAWQTTLSGPGEQFLIGVAEASDGDLVAVGLSRHDPTVWRSAAWMVRTNGQGAVRWSRTWTASGDAQLRSVVPLAGGDVLAGGSAAVARHRGADALLLRVDPSGSAVWEMTVGGNDDETLSALAALPAGDFAAGGTVDAYPTCRPYLLRFDDAGNVAWQRSVVTSTEACSSLTAIAPSSDGGFAWSGFDPHPQLSEVGTLHALTADGGALWKRTYQDVRRVVGVQAVPDGRYVLGGSWSGMVPSTVGPDGLVSPDCPYVVSSVPAFESIRTKPRRSALAAADLPLVSAPSSLTTRPMSLNFLERCRGTARTE